MTPPGRYLVLFQNNAELRPTGGFIGSFMVVDINNLGYNLVEFESNIHRRDIAFVRENSVEPPAPLNEIYEKWAMRGANWHPDFKNSAEQILWFFKREGGYDVDGIIAINATVARDLLEVLGPVTTSTGFEANHHNFLSSLQQEVERDYYKQEANLIENESKSVIKDIMSEMISRTKEPKNIVKVAKLIQKQIEEKHILLYNLNPETDQVIQKLSWGGRLKSVEKDYLYINNAGIVRSDYQNGASEEALETVSNKSGLNVGQKSFLEVAESGNNLHHRLYIERTHTGTGEWPDFHNYNYSRIFMPKDAQFVGAKYNDNTISEDKIIKEDFGDKKSYGLDFNTRIGQTSYLEVEYLTPKYDNWQLIYEKQPGVLNEYLRVDYKGKTIFDGVVTKNLEIKQ